MRREEDMSLTKTYGGIRGMCEDMDLTKTYGGIRGMCEDMSLTGTHGEILEATIQLLRREEDMSLTGTYGDIIERTIEVLRQEQDMELTQTVGKILNFANVTGRTKDRTAALETRTQLQMALANRRKRIGSPGEDNSWT